MSIFKRAPTSVPGLSKAVAATYKTPYESPDKIEALMVNFLDAASPDQVMELYWACFDDEVLRRERFVTFAVIPKVKSLGSQVFDELLTGLTDPDDKDLWARARNESLIQLLGEMGAMSAFQPILQFALKRPPRDRGSCPAALGNLRLANAAEWKKLALTCNEEEQQFVMGAGALTRASSYERMTKLEWQDEFYLPGEDRYE